MTEFAEVRDALDQMLDNFESFKKKQDQRAAEQQRAIDDLQLRLDRPGVLGAINRSAPVESKAWTSFLRRGVERMEDAMEVKSLIVSDDSRGGYLAPPEFIREVLKGVVEYSPIRQAARVGTTSAGSVLLPKRTGTPTAYWVGEVEERTETGSTYGQDEIPINESACYVDVSQRLLEDSAIDIAAEIAADLSEEFGRQEGASFVAGDGVKQPLGFLNTSGVATVANGHATVIQTDALINLLYTLPAYFRNRGSWIMSGSTLAKVRLLKDGQNNYLWQPSYQLGQPETLLGRPVIEAVDMPAVASNALPIAYADWSTAYRVYDKQDGLSLLRDPYSKATFGLVRFHARRRVGGQVVQPQAVKILKMVVS